ncbi:GNAT family N-acetyltransferase [Kordiimonas sp. SCSIO 12610]|uniref:GNAT family N-acetyltransferase n=1 Tax=Kordiimonas sp. SCSIO 12610 TaxID=2829597 RepID=UPI00210DBAB4|nr:N-acetyltransferase [Kordiimonas sp. SCSIO 12610]UTW54249.1 GNAT family N-acetyltransferase [Kordiimonas sp. SCSIO 12610]
MSRESIHIREATPKDAKALNAYIRLIFETSEHLITSPEEFRQPPWKQRMWIARKNTNTNETCIIALKDDKIVGMLDNWTDRRKRVKHVTTFATSVHPDYRGQGIARKLLNEFIDLVRLHPTLEKIELHVHADNISAIGLYEKMGFLREGIRSRAIKYQDGRVVDDILMAIWPNEHKQD